VHAFERVIDEETAQHVVIAAKDLRDERPLDIVLGEEAAERADVRDDAFRKYAESCHL
jgi:hypothetical protein